MHQSRPALIASGSVSRHRFHGGHGGLRELQAGARLEPRGNSDLDLDVLLAAGQDLVESFGTEQHPTPKRAWMDLVVRCRHGRPHSKSLEATYPLGGRRRVRLPPGMRPYRGWPFLSLPGHPVLSAVWAVLIHGLIALFAIWAILRHSRRPLPYAAIAFVAASLVDIDHVFAAGSLGLHRIESMSGRPDSHCLLAAVVLAPFGWALTGSRIVAWCVLAVVTSHLVFDAAGGGTPLFFPAVRPSAIPWLLCPVVLVALATVSLMLDRRADSTGYADRMSTLAQAAKGKVASS